MKTKNKIIIAASCLALTIAIYSIYSLALSPAAKLGRIEYSMLQNSKSWHAYEAMQDGLHTANQNLAQMKQEIITKETSFQ